MFGITEKEPAARAERWYQRGLGRAPAYPVSGVIGPDPGDGRAAPSAEPDALGKRRRLSHSAAIFGVATGLSRVLGLVREIVARRYFGVQGEINAFTVAFQVPNLVRALVADSALSPPRSCRSSASCWRRGRRRRAWRVASTVFWLLLLGLTGITALCMMLAPLVVAPFGMPIGYDDLAVTLSRILFPIVDAARRLGRHRRDPQQLRAVLDPGADAGRSGTSPSSSGSSSASHRPTRRDAKLYVYAGSILVGTIIQVLMPLPWLLRLDGRLHAAHRLARPGREAGVRPDDPGDARPRPHQLQRGHRTRSSRRATSTRGSRRARSTPPSASTCFRRGCSRSPSPRCCSRRSRASRPAGHGDASATPSAIGFARSRSCSCRRASPPPCSPSRSCGCSTSAASSRPTRRRSSQRASRRSPSGSRSTG